METVRNGFATLAVRYTRGRDTLKERIRNTCCYIYRGDLRKNWMQLPGVDADGLLDHQTILLQLPVKIRKNPSFTFHTDAG